MDKSNGSIQEGLRLFKWFHSFPAKAMQRVKFPRLMPPVVVKIGELKGIIYSSDRLSPGKKKTFIHFVEDPPQLVSNPEGTQLYIVGGSYRVTARGIEG